MRTIMIKSFFSFLGLLFLTFILWNRFIRERLPRDLYIHVYSLRFFITIIILLGLFVLLILSIKNIFSVETKSFLGVLLKNKYIAYIYNDIIVPIIEGPKQIYKWLYNFIEISFLIEPIHKIFFEFNIYNYCKYILLFLNIWRIIFVICFMLDVFYFQKFHYIYKIIYILIIPLLSNFILFMIDHHAKSLVEYLSTFVIIGFSEEEKGFTIEKNPSYKKDLKDDIIINFGELYINAQYTAKTFIHLNELKENVKNYLNIFFTTLYLIGWSFCLYISFSLPGEQKDDCLSSYFAFFLLLVFIYNFSLIIYLNRINKYFRSKITKIFEYFFMKRNSKYYVNFLTIDIEQKVLLFYCLFSFMPRYMIVIIIMINFLIIKITHILLILFSLIFIICLNNLYLYFYNKYLNKKLQKIEYFFGFITENYNTNIYYQELININDISMQKSFDTDAVLKEWILLKEKQTFIYYSISTKKGMNVYMNSIFSALLFLTIILTNIC